METLLGRYPVAGFTAIAYGLSWAVWVLTFRLIGDGVLTLPAIIVGGFGPMVAALLVASVRGHSPRETVRGWLQPRPTWRGAVVALAIPVAIVVVTTFTIAAVVGIPLLVSAAPERIGLFVAGLPFVFLLGGGQEEFGWRGFALPHLQRRYSALVASLIIGIIWTVWHLPLFVFQTQMYSISLLGFTAFVLVASVVFTAVYNATDGSVLTTMLLHASVNSSMALLLFPESAIQAMTVQVFGLLIALWGVVASAALVRYGHATLSPQPTASSRSIAGSE